MPRPKTPDLLKPSEVAVLLKISKQMVYWYIRRGVIPAGRVKGSRLLRIKRLDLNRVIAEWFKPREAERGETAKQAEPEPSAPPPSSSEPSAAPVPSAGS
jgi:excisionase family DNA binding protein